MATYSGISHRVRKHGTRDKESRDSILVKPFGNPGMYYTPEKVPGKNTTEKRENSAVAESTFISTKYVPLK